MLFRAPGSKLYAVTPDLVDTELLLEKCSAALSAGIVALQYRNKSAGPALRRSQAEQLSLICQRFDTPLIVNDDWQLAQEIGAAGAHLGREDDRLVSARRQFNGVLGVSCYNNLDLALGAEQDGADYVAFGSFFASGVKPHAPVAGLDLLELASKVLNVPIVAIGGITLHNAASLRAAGADVVAVISEVFNSADIGATVTTFNQLLKDSNYAEQSKSF